MLEFTDVVFHGAFATSDQACEAMRVLARVHGLSFTFNPGGGEFYEEGGSWRCQIHCCHDVEDYEKLNEAVGKLVKKLHEDLETLGNKAESAPR